MSYYATGLAHPILFQLEGDSSLSCSYNKHGAYKTDTVIW
jgi:hypothetical protein